MSNYRGSALEVLTVAFAGVSLVIVALRAVARHRIARVFEATDILLPISLVSRSVAKAAEPKANSFAGLSPRPECPRSYCIIGRPRKAHRGLDR